MSSRSSSAARDEKNVQKSHILCSNTARYEILAFVGEGRYGQVAKCVNLMTSQKVALKILKTEDTETDEIEITMLEAVSVLDPVKKNVVQIFEKFEHKGQTCLAFEMLDRNLFQLVRERHGKPLSLSEIRPVAQQLLTAFDALKGIGVVHADLKPENIMLADHLGEPFRVKLIDFGLSFTTSEARRGCLIQPLGYRAPEVILGLPISEAIDMWGLGCVLVWLFTVSLPFSKHCEYQTMTDIVEILGQPADRLLSAGYWTHRYFKMNEHCNNPRWRLKTPKEYRLNSGVKPKKQKRHLESLDDLLDAEKQESIELDDQRAFVSLLKSLLHTDSEERMTPKMALQHSFVTMAHLMEMDTSLYVDDSFEKMLVCPMEDLDKEVPHSKGALSQTSLSC